MQISRHSLRSIAKRGKLLLPPICMILIAGCAGSPLKVSTEASDPVKVQALDDSNLCADFLTLIFNNQLNSPTRNIFREVARRNLHCTGQISAYPMSSFFDEYKYPNITPDISVQILSDLKNGTINLDCENLCALSFVHKQSNLYALDIAENWKDLAVAVSQIGFPQDLAYYYLGQSAQGLGYHDAAIKYYSISAGIAVGPDKFRQCAAEAEIAQQVVPLVLFNVQPGFAGGCANIDIPSVVPVLIKASRDAMAKRRR